MKKIVLMLGASALALLGQQPSEIVLDKWLAAFNSGDRAKVEEFMKVHEPRRLPRLNETLEMREETGGLTKVKVEKADGEAVTAIVREGGGGGYSRLMMRIDPAPPYVIRGLRLEPADPPAEADGERLSFSGAVDATFAFARKQDFAGAVLIAGPDGKPRVEAFGLADREAKVANTAETKFRIGSMNKMMTSVAALQLVEKGKLKLDAPIGEVLTDYPNEKVRTQVTLRHLLTHTGGTGDIFGPEFDAKREQLRTVADYVNLYGKRDPEFAPGSTARYSNYGFMLVGALIEKASGQSYYDYIQKNIFDVAGMKASGSEPESVVGAQISKGYMRRAGQWESNVNTLPWRGSPAGGGYTTVGDLYKFATALQAGKFVSKAMLAQATSNQSKGDRPYGFGFGLRPGDAPTFGHGGGAPGMNGELTVYTKSGVIVVVLSNLDPPAASRVAGYLDTRLPVQR